MKIPRTYTISIENIEKLKKEANASDLIDDLLSKHYERQNLALLTDDEKTELFEAVKERDKLNKRIKELGFE